MITLTITTEEAGDVLEAINSKYRESRSLYGERLKPYSKGLERVRVRLVKLISDGNKSPDE